MRMSDEQVARQILEIFRRYRVPPEGFLKRTHFTEVRDADFRRGMDMAMAHGWLRPHERDRYRYILTGTGQDAFATIAPDRAMA